MCLIKIYTWKIRVKKNQMIVYYDKTSGLRTWIKLKNVGDQDVVRRKEQFLLGAGGAVLC